MTPAIIHRSVVAPTRWSCERWSVVLGLVLVPFTAACHPQIVPRPAPNVTLDSMQVSGVTFVGRFMRAVRSGAWDAASAMADSEETFLGALSTLGEWRGVVSAWDNEATVREVSGPLPAFPDSTILIIFAVRTRSRPAHCYSGDWGDSVGFLVRREDGRWRLVNTSPPLC